MQHGINLATEWPEIKIISDDASNVKKYVFTKDDAAVESVLYKYPDYQTRTVICCSTQSGCPVGCRFCGAGDYFVRSLTADEIVAQAVRCVNDTGVDPDTMGRLQIMFMSMGEPLLNMKALDPAIRTLYKLYPKAALLISTSAPKVNYAEVCQLSVDVPTVGLQFSVHESTNEARDKLVPLKGKLTLEDGPQAVLQLLRARFEFDARRCGSHPGFVRSDGFLRDGERGLRAPGRFARDQRPSAQSRVGLRK
jgi:23S rRNA (adenine2503-C2)-methyltransferase